MEEKGRKKRDGEGGGGRGGWDILKRQDVAVPLRLWILGYGLQCVLHMVCVCVEYRRRRRRRVGFGGGGGGDGGIGSDGNSSSGSRGDYGEYVSLAQLEDDGTSSVAKHLESANTMFSFIWWIIGFYWVSTGGQALADGSHRLYWLCIVFLGFDVFFVVFCVALACVIGIAVCCCLPCIIAILYAVTDQVDPRIYSHVHPLILYCYNSVISFGVYYTPPFHVSHVYRV